MSEFCFQLLKEITESTFASSKSTMKKPEQYVKLFKINNKGNKDNVIDVVRVSPLLTLI